MPMLMSMSMSMSIPVHFDVGFTVDPSVRSNVNPNSERSTQSQERKSLCSGYSVELGRKTGYKCLGGSKRVDVNLNPNIHFYVCLSVSLNTIFWVCFSVNLDFIPFHVFYISISFHVDSIPFQSRANSIPISVSVSMLPLTSNPRMKCLLQCQLFRSTVNSKVNYISTPHQSWSHQDHDSDWNTLPRA